MTCVARHWPVEPHSHTLTRCRTQSFDCSTAAPIQHQLLLDQGIKYIGAVSVTFKSIITLTPNAPGEPP